MTDTTTPIEHAFDVVAAAAPIAAPHDVGPGARHVGPDGAPAVAWTINGWTVTLSVDLDYRALVIGADGYGLSNTSYVATADGISAAVTDLVHVFDDYVNRPVPDIVRTHEPARPAHGAPRPATPSLTYTAIDGTPRTFTGADDTPQPLSRVDLAALRVLLDDATRWARAQDKPTHASPSTPPPEFTILNQTAGPC